MKALLSSAVHVRRVVIDDTHHAIHIVRHCPKTRRWLRHSIHFASFTKLVLMLREPLATVSGAEFVVVTLVLLDALFCGEEIDG